LLKYAPDFSYILKRQLTFIPVFGLYLIVGQQIAIDRASGRQALAAMTAKARDVVKAGRQIFIYPEGTRRPPGAPPIYKFGVIALYEATQAPILPVAVNTGLYWGRRGFLRRPGTAIVEYLPAIAPGLARDDVTLRLQKDIEEACARLNQAAVAASPELAPVLASGAESVA
jgi:1-acyl-sn-glycerol-3-phosphate acyltransferase